jgi:hypothetical protein
MMANSELLRLHEVRDAYRLIGDCRDLGHDPALWHRRMFDGVCRLIGVPAATGGEGRWLRPHRPVEAISTFDSGLDARGRRVLMAFMRDLGPAGDPMLSALQQVPGPLVTRIGGSSFPTSSTTAPPPSTSISARMMPTIDSCPSARSRATGPSA